MAVYFSEEGYGFGPSQTRRSASRKTWIASTIHIPYGSLLQHPRYPVSLENQVSPNLTERYSTGKVNCIYSTVPYLQHCPSPTQTHSRCRGTVTWNGKQDGVISRINMQDYVDNFVHLNSKYHTVLVRRYGTVSNCTHSLEHAGHVRLHQRVRYH